MVNTNGRGTKYEYSDEAKMLDEEKKDLKHSKAWSVSSIRERDLMAVVQGYPKPREYGWEKRNI